MHAAAPPPAADESVDDRALRAAEARGTLALPEPRAAVFPGTVCAGDPTKEDERGRNPSVVRARASADRATHTVRAMVLVKRMLLEGDLAWGRSSVMESNIKI